PHPPGDRSRRRRGRRSAQRYFHALQAVNCNRIVPRIPASPQPAGPGTAHAHQRAHAQRSAQRHRGAEEESDGENIKPAFSHWPLAFGSVWMRPATQVASKEEQRTKIYGESSSRSRRSDRHKREEEGF